MSQTGEGVNPATSQLHVPITLEALPEEWFSQQAEARVAWERLVEMAVPERSDYWKTQLQACIASQRASLISAYAQSWPKTLSADARTSRKYLSQPGGHTGQPGAIADDSNGPAAIKSKV